MYVGRLPSGQGRPFCNPLAKRSDLLFVMARVANEGGRGDILWQPAQSQQGQSG